MKTKILLSILALFACAATLSAITREQADEIVLEYLKDKETQHCILRVNVNTPNEEGIAVTTYGGEIFKAKYACWAYLIDKPHMSGPYLRRYLFVKEDNGSLLEVIVSDLFLPGNPDSWEIVKTLAGVVEPKANNKLLYPNPVGDWLTIPCNGENTRVEIYDLKGTRLLNKTLSGKDACQLNVSFLSAGVYMVNVEGKVYKIVKK